MRALYGDDLRFTVVAPRRPLFRRLGLPGVGEALDSALDAVEARTLWARFGRTAP